MSDSDHIHLKEFIERILDEREKALELTAKNLEQRLNGLNQLREEVTSDREAYLRKEVYDQMHNALYDRVSILEKTQARMVGIGLALSALMGILGWLLGKTFK